MKPSLVRTHLAVSPWHRLPMSAHIICLPQPEMRCCALEQECLHECMSSACAQAKRMAAAAKAAAAAKGSGQAGDEEQQPLMQQPGGMAVLKGDDGGVAKGSGEGRAMVMPMPGRAKEQSMSEAMLPTSVRIHS